MKSLENLSEDLKDLIRVQYPTGYESSISRITNAKKEAIFVFPLETDDATILVKVPATRNSEGEYDVESAVEPEGPTTNEEDDDYGSNDYGDNDNDDDYDENSPSKRREASYDPDFDS